MAELPREDIPTLRVEALALARAKDASISTREDAGVLQAEKEILTAPRTTQDHGQQTDSDQAATIQSEKQQVPDRARSQASTEPS